MMWDNDGNVGNHKTEAGLTRIAAPKLELPGNEASYNPPAEYLPNEAEVAAFAAMEDEDRPAFLPRAFGSLREVPAYARFIHERFERCLDLYLCPRIRRKRMNVSKPDDLLPASVPKPSSLKPFPNRLCITYHGHRGKVRPSHTATLAVLGVCVAEWLFQCTWQSSKRAELPGDASHG
jgi:ribosome biogenesis protein ERB1